MSGDLISPLSLPPLMDATKSAPEMEKCDRWCEPRLIFKTPSTWALRGHACYTRCEWSARQRERSRDPVTRERRGMNTQMFSVGGPSVSPVSAWVRRSLGKTTGSSPFLQPFEFRFLALPLTAFICSRDFTVDTNGNDTTIGGRRKELRLKNYKRPGCGNAAWRANQGFQGKSADCAASDAGTLLRCFNRWKIWLA